jgi:hypothetical protein
MQRTNLKLAIVAADKRHWRLAAEANRYLPHDQHLSEQHVTQIVTCRKEPTPEQAAALARVLGRPIVELFPEGRLNHA